MWIKNYFLEYFKTFHAGNRSVIDLRKTAKRLEKCKDAMWKRWTNEYLKELRERHNLKHNNKESSLKVGDVVIIKSDERNRNKWKLGHVENLIKGRRRRSCASDQTESG